MARLRVCKTASASKSYRMFAEATFACSNGVRLLNPSGNSVDLRGLGALAIFIGSLELQRLCRKEEPRTPHTDLGVTGWSEGVDDRCLT